MAAREPGAQLVPGGLGAIRPSAIEGADERQSRLVQPLLAFGLVTVPGAGLPKPALSDLLEQIRQALALSSGLLRKLVLEPR